MPRPVDSPNPKATRADTCQPSGQAAAALPVNVPLAVPVP
jgi:hypothetical protein